MFFVAPIAVASRSSCTVQFQQKAISLAKPTASKTVGKRLSSFIASDRRFRPAPARVLSGQQTLVAPMASSAPAPPLLYVLLCEDKPGAQDVRIANRAAHLDWIKSFGTKVKHAGPFLADDADGMVGSMLIVEGSSLEDVKAWAKDDPYAKAGLFSSVTVRRWKHVIKNE
eukprot:tig00000615_g2570.t1